LDAWRDETDWTHAERNEDQHQTSPPGAVRLSRLHFWPVALSETGALYLGTSPSKKSVSRLRRKVGGLLKPGNIGAWREVRDQLNAILRGWYNYFRSGSPYVQFRAVDHYVYDRVVHFQRRRHQTQSRGTAQYSEARVFGELGVLRMRDIALGVGSVR
jgi:RNA-directed DNA polymerase